MVVLSVTYRPEVLKLSIEDFYSIVQHKSVSKYYIGSETADDESDVINHYQCYIDTTQSADNFRKRIKKALKIENVHALKVEKHNDPQYLLGYCQKEQRGFLTNIETEERKQASKYYNDKKEVIEDNKNDKYVSFNADTIVEEVLKMHIANNEESYNPIYFIEFMRKYKAQIKFHVFSKLNQSHMKKYIEIQLVPNEQIELLQYSLV